MKSPGWFKWALVFSAYLPLFLIITIQRFTWPLVVKAHSHSSATKSVIKEVLSYINAGNVLIILASLCLLFSILCSILLLSEIERVRRKKEGRTIGKIISVTSREQDFLVYLVTYIPPILTYAVETWRDLSTIVILVVMILWLSLRTELLYINPVLMLFGYRLYSVETESFGSALLLSKHERRFIERFKTRELFRFESTFVLIDGSQRGVSQ